MIGQKDKYALITGASSGIGYELAKLFAKDGKGLIIVSRNKDKLEQVKAEIEDKYHNKVKILPKDLSHTQAPLEIYSELEKEDIGVDVLVNNAGFGVFGLFSETDLEEEFEMIQLHVSSMTHLTKLFLKNMLANKFGRILNVASLIGFMPVPLFSVYAASKAYTLHFSEALACELQGTGVSATCLCPSPTDTLFNQRGNVENSKSAKGIMIDAATAAKAGYIALKKGKVITVPGIKGGALLILVRIAPRNLITKFMRAMA
jgi:short-subunit dehydrogenase